MTWWTNMTTHSCPWPGDAAWPSAVGAVDSIVARTPVRACTAAPGHGQFTSLLTSFPQVRSTGAERDYRVKFLTPPGRPHWPNHPLAYIQARSAVGGVMIDNRASGDDHRDQV